MPDKIFITGATGFVGRHLVNYLAGQPEYKIRILSRNKSVEGSTAETVIGDLTNEDDVRRFIDGPGVLVNLAYNSTSFAENTIAAKLLTKRSIEIGIKRIIHVSTATVCGRTPNEIITEETSIQPFTDYEKSKAELEATFSSIASADTQVVILRPTAVFGAGGKNLVKPFRDRLTKTRFFSYVVDSIYANRSLHLVPVQYLVQAIAQCLSFTPKTNCSSYIISYDDHSLNNYSAVTDVLDSKLGSKKVIPRMSFLKVLLPGLLRLRNRSSVSGERKYLSSRIEDLNLSRPDFKKSLEDFFESQLRESAR